MDVPSRESDEFWGWMGSQMADLDVPSAIAVVSVISDWLDDLASSMAYDIQASIDKDIINSMARIAGYNPEKPKSLIVPCSQFVPYIPDTCSICGKTHCAHLGGDGMKDSTDSLFGQMYAATAIPESYFNKFAQPSLIILPESKILKCPPLVTYS